MRKFFVAVVVLFMVGCSAPQTDVLPPAPAPSAAKTPTCAVSMSAPRAVEGANFFGTGTLSDCSETDWDGVLQLRFAQDSFWAGIDIDRTQAAAGDTLDLGSQAVAFTNTFGTCEGAVTWISDEPDWALSVNAVCHGDAGDYDFVGSFHGHVYDGNQ